MYNLSLAVQSDARIHKFCEIWEGTVPFQTVVLAKPGREQLLKKLSDATKFTIFRSAIDYADNTATLSARSSLVIARGRVR